MTLCLPWQALNWICSAIFTLSMTHLFSSNDVRSFRKIAANNELRLALVLAFLSITYLIAFFGVSLAAHDIAKTTSRDRSANELTSYVPPMYYLGVVAFVWYLDKSFTVRTLVTVSTMLFFAALHLSKQISLHNVANAQATANATNTAANTAAAESGVASIKKSESSGTSIIDSSSAVCKADSASVLNLFKRYDVDTNVRTANWYRQIRYDLAMYVVPLTAVGVAVPMLRPLVHFIVFCLTFFLPVYMFITKSLYFRESPRENECIAADRLTSYPHKYVNGWFRVMGAEELKPGTVKYIAANGRHMAVFRGESDHKVKCIDAHCVHLGANMAIGGTVVDNCLECPFHRWQFNGNGQCTHIPYTEAVPTSTRTRAYHVCEYYEEIIVWIHSEDIAPTYYPPNIPKIDSVSGPSFDSATIGIELFAVMYIFRVT
jgi:nitrite reductase/ring-hydroxylating ferredoxin subunit